jgi:A/G-specific adenine glycosylase
VTVISVNERRRLKSIATRLEKWFYQNGRRFSWRDEKATHYEQICTEILLQQTRAETVENNFQRFFESYPDWTSLNKANEIDLRKSLKPFGIWRRRAKSFKGISNYAVKHNGNFPDDYKELLKITAVGPYVANSILLFQYNKSRPLLDMNMARVLERYFKPRKLADIRYDSWLNSAGQYLVRNGNARIINWAILDLGALVCTSRKALCNKCPLSRGCSKNIN